ncbi:nucleotidyltransferase domain-containing protein [Candidatus Dojkabacteria bacterium]|jgi:hypothetical protein|nr:nucleotidyltransferase domain-containing protein [Candidatus Dojkabacteria bacterium]
MNLNQIQLIGKIKEETSSKNATLFNMYISGSHLYGWESKNSDIDIRGCFAYDKTKFLGLSVPNEVINIKINDTDKLNEDLDIVLFEIKKMINLALQGNCNILEELNAPQLYKSAEFIELRRLINNSWGKMGIYGSYKGLAEFNYKKFILQGRHTVKKYLYVFRGLMAGIHALQSGDIQPNITELNKSFKIPEVTRLVEIKKAGLEEEELKELENGILDKLIADLFLKLDEAFLKSKIPNYPDEKDIEKINTYLINIRIRGSS